MISIYSGLGAGICKIVGGVVKLLCICGLKHARMRSQKLAFVAFFETCLQMHVYNHACIPPISVTFQSSVQHCFFN